MNIETISALSASLSQCILAQISDSASGDAAVRVQSIWEFVVKGGPIMIPIGICSLVALTVIVERLVSLRRRQVIPPTFLEGLTNLLNENSNDTDKAIDYCRQDGSPIANIFAAAIKRFGESIEQMEKHIEEAGRREITKLRKYLRLLSVTASIAPLMGLLGTIFGMIAAFQTVAASGEALGKTELLAKGIYQAMISTAAGLTLAIPVLIAYHWISAKIDALVTEMDTMTVDFIEQYAQPQTETVPPRSKLQAVETKEGEPDRDGVETAAATA